MQNNYYNPVKLIEHVRDGLVEQEHSGFVVLKLGSEEIDIGDSLNYPFYLRSCAKPLQAAIMIDETLDVKLGLTSEEIAIACASHAGEKCHVDAAKSFLAKTGIDESFIKCGFHKPLAKSVKFDKDSVFYNNCVGKHIMMLALSEHFGFSLENYYEKTHPLQLLIKKKVYELCEYDGDTPVTTDGCGVPIFSMPLKNMLTGFLNLFCNEKYSKIKNAFLHNPYIIGGEDRLDTKVMQNSPMCTAKVGAGGICIVVNTLTSDGFIVKMLDADMNAREFVVLNLLKQLGWSNIEIDNSIKTLHNQIVGKKEFLFDLYE
ncbi:asparaginase [bacterium]|nr:asparaginase [bacterium]